MANGKEDAGVTGLEIAVIGMAGRFPGAKNIDRFWDNLKNGVETITFFTRQELEEAGVNPQWLEHPDYVKANGILEDKEFFDYTFFDYTAREAEVMDPQMRLFHECCWEALESAGVVPGNTDGLIGLYAGSSTNFEWEALALLSGKNVMLGDFAASQLIKKDYLCTRISYRLNLKGPSVFVQTTCSTSLVAIHMAAQALLSGECDMALAGGVSINMLTRKGYMHQEGMIASPDGHCRAFDRDAGGTVAGEGAGVVLLKRLQEAVEDRDYIHAVIKGTAINNDGDRKVGYTAPSIAGQAEVIVAARLMADVDAESITYIEAHGTGTALGDPVEIEALTRAFNTDKKQFCGVGSVKTNVGHLDTAAGVCGFIKTVQALKHRKIPPSLHYKSPNPKIDFENSPFYVNDKLKDWASNGGPLRAGVSSFGIGGTNAHIILEEAPIVTSRHRTSMTGAPQLMVWSAKTASALEKATENLARYLDNNPAHHPADIAYTLNTGREAFPYRRMMVVTGIEEARQNLENRQNGEILTGQVNQKEKDVVFMFSGQGAQYVDMGAELYRQEPVFRKELDRCFNSLRRQTGIDIKEKLYPAGGPKEQKDKDDVPEINRTEITQPVLLAFEYALARLLMHWGITPRAMIGHSIGEYTAACIAGVLTLEDALKLVAARGKLMQEVSPGAMTAVPMREETLRPLMTEDVCLAAVNSTRHTVVSGTFEAIGNFEKYMEDSGHRTRRLQTSHAFHSKMMEPVLERFGETLAQVTFREPKIPFISNLTGAWITEAEAKDPGYWKRHLRETVRFSDGLKQLFEKDNLLLVEVGPGRALTTFARKHGNRKPRQQVVNLVRHPNEDEPDDRYLHQKLGQLFLEGITIDWEAYYEGRERRRLPLPTYPFEGKYLWLKGDPYAVGAGMMAGQPLKETDLDAGEGFYIPSWERSVLTEGDSPGETSQSWLIFSGVAGPVKELETLLKSNGDEVVTVNAAGAYEVEGDRHFYIKPTELDHYERLFKELIKNKFRVENILNLWNIKQNEKEENVPGDGYFCMVYVPRALEAAGISGSVQLVQLTDRIQQVTGNRLKPPEHAVLQAPVKVIPTEFSNIRCRSIDIDTSEFREKTVKQHAEQLVRELRRCAPEPQIAYRNNFRWVETYTPIRLPASKKTGTTGSKQGIILVLGGFELRVLQVLEQMAIHENPQVLVLVDRQEIIPKQEWERELEQRDDRDPVYRQIQYLRRLEENDVEIVCYSIDATELPAMMQVVEEVREKWGPVTGIIDADVAYQPSGPIVQWTVQVAETLRGRAVKSHRVLEKLFQKTPPDYYLQLSSMDAVNGTAGRLENCAAGLYRDAYAQFKSSREKTLTVSVNLDHRLTPVEIWTAIERIRFHRLNRAAVTKENLEEQIRRHNRPEPTVEEENTDHDVASIDVELLQPRRLSVAYEPPVNEIQQKLVHLWQEFFGIARVGIRDDFFEMGGDSLQAMTISNNIHKLFDVKIPLQDFFTVPTIEKLAEYIERQEGGNVFMPIELIEEKEYYVLSSAQRRLYIIQQMDKNFTGYNMPSAALMEGKLEREKLEQTFRQLIRRHESLRTTFRQIGMEVRQQIHRDVPFDLEYFEKDQQHIKDTVGKFVRPFDLERAPLIRVGLVKILNTGENRSTDDTAQRHVIIIDQHHIISDGTSGGIFVKEFMALYEGKELPEPTIQYKDYALWQQNQRHSPDYEKQKNYWLNQFEGEIPVLRLPCDNERPVVKSVEGDVISFEIGTDDTRELKALAVKEEATLFMLLISLYNIMLAKLSGQEDIVVGVPIAGRGHPDLQQVIGVFVGTLAMRNNPVGDKTYGEFLKEVKKRTLDAFENQDYPFEELVDQVSAQRDSGRNPLCDTAFVLQNFQVNEVNIPGLKLTPYSFDISTSRFDMTFQVVEAADKMYVSIEYCTALLKTETIRRFIGYYRQLISSVTAPDGKDQRLVELEMMPTEEKQQLLIDVNDTEAEYPKDVTINELFSRQVEKNPDKIALVGKEGNNNQAHCSYGHLYRRAAQLAVRLAAEGVGVNHIVGVMMERSIEMLEAMLGIQMAGAAYLPIDPDNPTERIRYMLDDAGVKIICTGKKMPFQLKNQVIVPMEKNKIDEGDNPSTPESKATSGDLLYIIYTSGTTGKPKGVLIRQKGFVNLVYGHRSVFNENEEARVSQTASAGFDAMAFEVWPALTAGSALYIADDSIRMDPRTMKNWLIKHKITISFQPTMLAQYLLEQDWNKGTVSLRKLRTAGDRLTIFPKKTYPFRFYNMYGPTEDTVWTTSVELTESEPETSRKYRFPSIGRPVANHRVYILGPKLELQPLGVPGELLIGGDGLALGYLNRPELTAQKFITSTNIQHEPRLYRTGDQVRWLPDGNIDFLGRIDQQVKIRGFRIELEEIEKILQSHNDIRETVVMAIEENGNSEAGARKYLCAYYVEAGGNVMQNQSPEIYKAYLSQKLPQYMVPSYYVRLEKMPLNRNGKVDRNALRKKNEGKITLTDYEEPRTQEEQKIADVWRQVLNVERVGIHDNFFHLGGDSMTTIKAALILTEDFRISTHDIFRYQTVAELAANITVGEENLLKRLESVKNRLKEQQDQMETQENTSQSDNDEQLNREYRDYREKAIESQQEVELSPEYKNQYKTHYKNILLTGATGYLGAHLAAELLNIDGTRIHILLRGEDEEHAQQRFRQKMNFYFGEAFYESNRRRIDIIAGDLRKEKLGLTDQRYEEICRNLDAVLHSAANVKHLGRYEDFHEDNVMGTLRLLELTRTHKPKDFHFISTISVGNGMAEDGKRLFNEFSVDGRRNYGNDVYIKSKWEAELKVQVHKENGGNAAIYRVGNLAAQYETGIFQQNIEENAFYNNIQAQLLLGAIPLIPGMTVDMSYVDYTARAIVLLMMNRPHVNGNYHVLNHRQVGWSKLGNMIKQTGINVEIENPLQFLDRIIRFLEENKNKRTSPSDGSDTKHIENKTGTIERFLYQSGILEIREQRQANNTIASDMTQYILEKLGFQWPEVTQEYVDKMIAHCKDVGFL